MEAAVKAFFLSSRFAVAGASQDSSKFGYKVLAWYHAHNLPVTPINPLNPEIKFPSRAYATVTSPLALPSPSQTSMSVVTPPAVTRRVLEEAKTVGVSAVWLQPGTFDIEGLEYAKANFKAAVGGETADGGEGLCVLHDGESALKAIDRQWTQQKL